MDQLSFSSVSTQTRKTKRTDIESPLSLSLENCEAPHSLDSLDEVSATLDNYSSLRYICFVTVELQVEVSEGKLMKRNLTIRLAMI